MFCHSSRFSKLNNRVDAGTDTPLGVRVRDLPLTCERVMAKLLAQ